MSKEQPAFPAYFTSNHAIAMTLRDYFAAKAMQAMLTATDCDLKPLTEVPQAAYDMADAMMEAREK